MLFIPFWEFRKLSSYLISQKLIQQLDPQFFPLELWSCHPHSYQQLQKQEAEEHKFSQGRGQEGLVEQGVALLSFEGGQCWSLFLVVQLDLSQCQIQEVATQVQVPLVCQVIQEQISKMKFTTLSQLHKGIHIIKVKKEHTYIQKYASALNSNMFTELCNDSLNCWVAQIIFPVIDGVGQVSKSALSTNSFTSIFF